MPEPGAELSFSFLTDHGQETYSYDWTKYPAHEEHKPLTVLKHVGKNPLWFSVGRSGCDLRKYRMLVKWIKVLNWYIDDQLMPSFAPEQLAAYRRLLEAAQPFLTRLDRATASLLLPSLADGQIGFVLGADLKSKQWWSDLPKSKKPLPILEPALVIGVTDASRLQKAIEEYWSIADEVLVLASLDQQKIRIPPPESKRSKEGTLYFYPLPSSAGFDKRIMPTGGLTEHLAVLTMSQSHATRLLRSTPVRLPSGLSVDATTPLSHASYLNWAGFMELIRSWAHYGFQVAEAEKNVSQAVDAILDFFAALRSISSVTYRADGAIVTHSKSLYRDVD